MTTARSQLTSLVIHLFSLALLLIVTSQSFRTPSLIPPLRVGHVVPLAPLRLAARVQQDHGGGSNRSAAPARRGVPPVRSSHIFIPPTTHPEPKLAMLQSIDFELPVIGVSTERVGDPFSTLPDGLFGDKGGITIGNRPNGPRIGDGTRPDGSGRFGVPSKQAEVIYRVEPEFSEEARKARFQGIVVLMIEVGTDGRAHNLKVVQTAGLGLDEKAIEAVQKWRFRPAQRGSTLLVSTALIEVHFHLL